MNINDHAEEFFRGMESMVSLKKDNTKEFNLPGLIVLALALSAAGLVSGYALLHRL